MMSKPSKKRGEGLRKRLQKRFPPNVPGKASDYIEEFKKLEKNNHGQSVVLFARVSSGPQESRGNLDTQINWLRAEMEDMGVSILTEIKSVGSGWWREFEDLKVAAKAAKEAGAIVLAVSTDRFIRSVHFHTKNNPDVEPTVAEYEALLQAAGGVTLATLLPPDMPSREIRSYYTKEGQKAKGNKGGRPKKKKSPGYYKQRCIEMSPHVRRMRAAGISYGDISIVIKVPKQTVWSWMNKRSDGDLKP